MTIIIQCFVLSIEILYTKLNLKGGSKMTKGVAANIMFLSKPKILIENCDGQVVPWFSGPEEIIPVAIWHTRSATEF